MRGTWAVDTVNLQADIFGSLPGILMSGGRHLIAAPMAHSVWKAVADPNGHGQVDALVILKLASNTPDAVDQGFWHMNTYDWSGSHYPFTADGNLYIHPAHGGRVNFGNPPHDLSQPHFFYLSFASGSRKTGPCHHIRCIMHPPWGWL